MSINVLIYQFQLKKSHFRSYFLSYKFICVFVSYFLIPVPEWTSFVRDTKIVKIDSNSGGTSPIPKSYKSQLFLMVFHITNLNVFEIFLLLDRKISFLRLLFLSLQKCQSVVREMSDSLFSKHLVPQDACDSVVPLLNLYRDPIYLCLQNHSY